jgi:hypothetical protein
MNSSKAGKIAGKLAVKTGQIKQFIAAAATPEARQKAYETCRKKGIRAFTSKVEDSVYEILCERFGAEDVKRWKYITRSCGTKHNVDLFIISLNTYIEVDGEYWHGLDRPYEELPDAFRAKFDHDRALDTYCVQNAIKLVRVTDLEIKANGLNIIFDRLV